MNKEFSTLAWVINGLLTCALTWRGRSKVFHRWQLLRHLAAVGSHSLAIVSVIAACTGIILALQGAQQLERIGALSYVASFVGVTIIEELGPLLTAIILTGRSGAAFTAEISTMRINEEVDALDVIGLDPIRFLVWPKFVSMLVMLPVLTIWADFIGILAGGVFSVSVLGLTAKTYYDNTVDFVRMAGVLSGLVKSMGFGAAITVISCWQGFLAWQGAMDVGLRTTKSVVLSIFCIILLDLFFTTLNYIFL